jgi:hypothetical protein
MAEDFKIKEKSPGELRIESAKDSPEEKEIPKGFKIEKPPEEVEEVVKKEAFPFLGGIFGSFVPQKLGLSGTGTDTTFTLTNANTAYAVPESPPTDFYTLIICNDSDTAIYFRFTEGTTAGVKIAPGSSLSVDLGPNQKVYVYCGTAGKTINLSYKII